MRNLFIDAGSFDGCTTRLFRQKYGEGWEIHCFEPDPRIENNEPGIILHREAVWTIDGEVQFYLGRPESSTLIEGKTTGEVGKHGSVRVACIDFSRWLAETIQPGDNVLLKLNIEGAEYPVLNRMLEQGTVGLIRLMVIEWHARKIPMKTGEHDQLLQRLNAAGVKHHPICGTDWLE